MNDPIGEVVWEGTGQERVVEEAAAYQQQQCNTRQHQPSVQCSSCKRFFSREADKTRNKCSGERGNPLELQRGSVQCPVCFQWFKSRRGLAVQL